MVVKRKRVHRLPSDPAQLLANYSYGCPSEEWKMTAWESVVHDIALCTSLGVDFLVTPEKIWSAVNETAKSSGSQVMFSAESVGDTLRGLLNKRLLLRSHECLAHASSDLWDVEHSSEDARARPPPRLELCRRQQTQITCTESGGILSESWGSALLGWFNSKVNAGWGWWSSSGSAARDGDDYLDERDSVDDHLPGHLYVVRRECQLPYTDQPAVTAVHDFSEKLIALAVLEEISQTFIRAMRAGALRQHARNSSIGRRLLDSFSEELIVPIDVVSTFLQANLTGSTVSNEHVEIFLWHLKYFVGVAAPFIVRQSHEAVSSDQKVGDLKFVKLASADGGGSKKLEVRQEDRAAAMEAFALGYLHDRVAKLTEKTEQTDRQCKQLLQQGHKEAALNSLRLKKMMEAELKKTTDHIMQIEGMAQIRDRGSAMVSVVSALQATLAASKAVKIDQQEVLEVAQQMANMAAEAEFVDETLGSLTGISAGPVVDDEDVEEELRSMMAAATEKMKQVEETPMPAEVKTAPIIRAKDNELHTPPTTTRVRDDAEVVSEKEVEAALQRMLAD